MHMIWSSTKRFSCVEEIVWDEARAVVADSVKSFMCCMLEQG